MAATRSREVEALLAHLHLNRVAILTGESGTGKSSLVQAGLLARLAAGPYPDVRAIYIDRGYESPLHTARAALAEIDPGGTTLRGQLHAISNRGYPLLIFDQFEQLFVATPPGPRRRFITELSEVLRDETLEASVLVVIRREWFTHLHDIALHQTGATGFLGNTQLLSAFAGANATKNVRDGLRFIGTYSEGLVSAIRSDLERPGRGVLQVELALVGTSVSAQGITTPEQYWRMGRKDQLLRSRALDTLAGLPIRLRGVAHRCLIALGAAESGRLALDERTLQLASLADRSDDISRVLERLVACTVLRRTGAETVEFVHDYIAAVYRDASEAQVSAPTTTNTRRMLELVRSDTVARQLAGRISAARARPGYGRFVAAALASIVALHAACLAYTAVLGETDNFLRFIGAMPTSLACGYVAYRMALGALRLLPGHHPLGPYAMTAVLWVGYALLAIGGMWWPNYWLVAVGGGATMMGSLLLMWGPRYRRTQRVAKRYRRVGLLYLGVGASIIAIGWFWGTIMFAPVCEATLPVPAWVVDIVAGALLTAIFTYIALSDYGDRGMSDWKGLHWTGEMERGLADDEVNVVGESK